MSLIDEILKHVDRDGEIDPGYRVEVDNLLAAHDRDLVNATVEKCCKAMCSYCRDAAPIQSKHGTYLHNQGGIWSVHCDATPIRRMVAGE